MKKPVILVVLIWAAVTLGFAVLLLALDIHYAHMRFRDTAHRVYSQVLDQERSNEAVLSGFAAMFALLDRDDYERARSYARDVRVHHPQILKLEAQIPVTRERIAEVERDMARAGHEGFTIRTFGYATDRRWGDVQDKAHYYPIVFQEPLTPDSRAILGLDVHSVPHLRQALEESIESGSAVASPPFELAQGGRGYVIFMPVRDRAAGPAADVSSYGDTVVSAVIRTDLIFDSANPCSSPRTACALYYRGEAHGMDSTVSVASALAEPSAGVRLLLPRFRFDEDIDASGQSFRLIVDAQMGLEDVHLPRMMVLTAGAIAALAALLALLRARLRSDTQRDRLLRELSGQKQDLDKKVRERTLALSQFNARLSQEAKERQKVEQQLRRGLAENRRLSRELINMEERQNKALARELHDEMGQCITAIKTDAVLVRQATGQCPIRGQRPECIPAIQNSAEAIADVADHIYGIVRGMIRRLRPSILDELGLVPALQECIHMARLDTAGVTCYTNVDGDFEDLDEEAATALYRVCQEAITNVHRHANAHTVSISLTRDIGPGGNDRPDRDTVRLSISDDGVGMPSTTTTSGFGLLGLRERIEGMGGQFEIITAPRRGLTIQAVLHLDRRTPDGD